MEEAIVPGTNMKTLNNVKPLIQCFIHKLWTYNRKSQIAYIYPCQFLFQGLVFGVFSNLNG